MSTPLRRKAEDSSGSLKVFFLIIAALLVVVSLTYYLPSYEMTQLNNTGQLQIYFQGELTDSALYREEEIYLPLSFIKEKLDPNILWDEKSKTVIITTDKEVFHLPLGKREGMVNLQPYSFSYPVIEEQGKIYLPLQPLDKYYNFEVKHIKDESVLAIHDLKEPLTQGVTLADVRLRAKPSLKAPWLYELEQGNKVYIMKEEQGWFWIETEEGQMGYINEKDAQLSGIKWSEIKKEPYQPWNPLGERIILTWEGAWGATVNPEKLGDLAGVQVLSPTWFSLAEDGLVKNTADLRYVNWAHSTGRQVWGLFDNSFDKDLTHNFLQDAELRAKAIKQLLTYVELYQLDGINLDFENMHLKDKDAYTQFVRELAPLLHEKDRSISVNVTFISKSENWSMIYDRKALGEIVDYITVMAYDENGTFSKTAGSVASIPWVEKGIKEILKEMPHEKIILGVPFYTRLWEERIGENGEMKLTSKAISMTRAESWVKENNLKPEKDPFTGQNYVAMTKNDVNYKMWLEDEVSLEQRTELMKKFRLAGLAAWRRGFEKEETWPVLNKMVNSR